MASAIRLSDDGTYKFILMYGNVDESDVGTWRQVGTKVILNSTALAADPQFNLVGSSKEGFSGVRVVFEEEGIPTAAYVTRVGLLSNGRRYYANGISSTYREATSASAPIEKINISLLGVVRNYREIEFVPKDSTHNNFTVRASIGNYGLARFENALLSIAENEVTLKLPHIVREFTYVRVSESK